MLSVIEYNTCKILKHFGIPLKIYGRPTQVLTGYDCTRAELPDWDGHVIGRYAETMFLKKYGLGGLIHRSETPCVAPKSSQIVFLLPTQNLLEQTRLANSPSVWPPRKAHTTQDTGYKALWTKQVTSHYLNGVMRR
jgi:hypothetical protein